jgi:hypothetical protein
VPEELDTTAMFASEANSQRRGTVSQTVETERGSSSPGPIAEFLEPPGDIGGIECPAVFHGEDVALGLLFLRRCLSLLGLP